MFQLVELSFSQSYDCMILVHPQIQMLDELSDKLQSRGIAHFNISQKLSSALITLSTTERGRFAEKWLKDTLGGLYKNPILCTHPDLLFHPSLEIDPFTLFCQAARFRQMIVLWPGEYSIHTLSYAVPEHHHYRIWKISDFLLIQPKILIYQISTKQGA